MLTDITAAKIDHGLAKLAMDQLAGSAPLPGEVSIEDLATRAGVSKQTVAKLERIALAKVAAGLLARGLDERLAKRIAHLS